MNKRNLKVIVFISLFLTGLLLAQECGPFCPVCSGSGSSTGALVDKGVLIPNMLYIPNGEEETAVFNIRRGLTSWLDIGLGYALKSEKVLWSARIQCIREKESSWIPALIIGTGSVQTGKADQSVFLQVTKAWEFSEVFALRLSTGAASLISDLNKLYGIAGMTLTITDRWSPFLSYDGLNFHTGLSWFPVDWMSVSGIWV